MPAALGLTGLPQLTHAPQQPGSLPATNPHQQLQQLTAASLPPQYTQHLGRIDKIDRKKRFWIERLDR